VRSNCLIVGALLLLALPATGSAQDTPRSAIEVSGGFAGFLDESVIRHGTLGTALRWDLGRRFSVGPEFVYMKTGGDQDFFVTGKVVIDFLPNRQVSPYFVADGGVMLHRATNVRNPPFWSREGAVSFGGGARINLTPRFFVAPEIRIGWEPHIRVTTAFGWRL
jgi:hypothetical protein